MKIKRWQLHVGYQVALAIVFIIVLALQGCATYTCSYYSKHVRQMELCVDSPDCTFTDAEFRNYKKAVMIRDANCPR